MFSVILVNTLNPEFSSHEPRNSYHTVTVPGVSQHKQDLSERLIILFCPFLVLALLL